MTGPPLRIGVLTPHTAPGPEVELPAMAPPGTVDVTLARTPTPADLSPALDRLRRAQADVVAYASTTTGYALGARGEAALTRELTRAAGVPVISSASAAARAVRALGARRVTLVHPPWFDDAFRGLGEAYFRGCGFDAVAVTAAALPPEPARVRTAQVVACVGGRVGPPGGVVFLAGNGFRAAGAVDALERRTGAAVLTANQVVLWAALAATGATVDVRGYGRLFRAGIRRVPSS